MQGSCCEAMRVPDLLARLSDSRSQSSAGLHFNRRAAWPRIFLHFPVSIPDSIGILRNIGSSRPTARHQRDNLTSSSPNPEPHNVDGSRSNQHLPLSLLLSPSRN